MTTLAQAFGNSTSFTVNNSTWTNLNTISTDALSVAGLSPVPDDILITVDFAVPAGSLANQKAVNVWIAISEDGTHYTDNDQYSGSNNTKTSVRSPANFYGPFPISTPTASLTYYGVFSLRSMCGGVLPRAFGLVLENQTGLVPTSPAATYTAVTWTNS